MLRAHGPLAPSAAGRGRSPLKSKSGTGTSLPCLATLVIFLGACNFQQAANAKFGDQHFKTAVSLIELYKVRNGSYPESLDNLEFTGDWDAIALHSVEYKKLDEGYELNVINGWVGQPSLGYPEAFWRGLGIRKSNVERKP